MTVTHRIRPEQNEADREFILGLNIRLADVIDAPTHSKQEVTDFQDRFTRSAWENTHEAHTTLIAESETGQRLGYVHVRESDDEISQNKCAYISLLAVTEEAEGTGVAQSLVEEAENWSKANGFTRIALEVFASNIRGQKFYEKVGFQPETLRILKKV